MGPHDEETVIRRIIADGRLTLRGRERRAFLICAQPGAGKTRLASELKRTRNAAFINADEYRRYYPNYRALFRAVGDEVIALTSEFSGRITERLIDRLSADGYNLIVEGTMRTAEVPERTGRLLRSRGYKPELDVLLVRPEISWLRTLRRYAEMTDAGTTPRKTAQSHHDSVVVRMPENLERLCREDVFYEVRIYQERKGRLESVYSQREMPEKNPASLLREEFSRGYTKEEVAALWEDYRAYLSREEFVSLFAGKILRG